MFDVSTIINLSNRFCDLGSIERTDIEAKIEISEEIASLFRKLDLEDRNRAKDAIEGQSRSIISISGRLAGKAIDTGEEHYLITAIVLHVIEDFRFDYRENFRLLALVYYACTILGVDMKSAIESCASLMSTEAHSYLDCFANRDPAQNRLDLFHISVDSKDGNTIFRQMPDRKFTKPNRRASK